jgi:hypothetical protein
MLEKIKSIELQIAELKKEVEQDNPSVYKKGDKVKLYGHEWLIVWTDGKTAKLWMTEPFAAYIFSDENNNYETSIVRKFLQEKESEFNGDKLFLPSVEEVKDNGEWGLTGEDRKFTDIKFGYYAWLRSPSSNSPAYASFVRYVGTLYSFGRVSCAAALRPCVKVKEND